MRRGVSWLVALVLMGTQLARGEEEEHPPEPVGTSVTERDGVTIHEAILPGDLVDWSGLPDPTGLESMVILSQLEGDQPADGSDERQVWSWHLAGRGKLEKVGPPLTEDATGVVVLRSHAAGEAQVLVTVGERLLGIGPGGEWIERFSSDYDLFPVRDHRGGRPLASKTLFLRSLGRLQALELDSAAHLLHSAWMLDLPLTVDREWGALRLETPSVAVFRNLDGESTQLVMGPDTQGKRRIRTTLITVGSTDAPEVVETWNMLSNLEDVEESWYVTYQGSPAVIVTTVLADKHGVFEKKKLRLFALTADRTRAGSGPLLEAMTRSRNWYGTCAGIADVNDDDIDDLVSAQPKGLGAGSLWVEAHLGTAGGGFDSKARGSEIEVEEGEVCTLAVDVTGDETVDLVVVEDESVLVFPLLSAREAKTVVDTEPLFRVPFDGISGRPRPFDSSSQVPSRMVVTGRTQGKMQAVRLVRFR